MSGKKRCFLDRSNAQIAGLWITTQRRAIWKCESSQILDIVLYKWSVKTASLYVISAISSSHFFVKSARWVSNRSRAHLCTNDWGLPRAINKWHGDDTHGRSSTLVSLSGMRGAGIPLMLPGTARRVVITVSVGLYPTLHCRRSHCHNDTSERSRPMNFQIGCLQSETTSKIKN